MGELELLNRNQNKNVVEESDAPDVGEQLGHSETEV